MSLRHFTLGITKNKLFIFPVYKAIGIEEEICGVGVTEEGCVLPPPQDDPCLILMEKSIFGRVMSFDYN